MRTSARRQAGRSSIGGAGGRACFSRVSVERGRAGRVYAEVAAVRRVGQALPAIRAIGLACARLLAAAQHADQVEAIALLRVAGGIARLVLGRVGIVAAAQADGVLVLVRGGIDRLGDRLEALELGL